MDTLWFQQDDATCNTAKKILWLYFDRNFKEDLFFETVMSIGSEDYAI